MKLKTTLLTLLVLLGIGLTGCSSNSEKSTSSNDNQTEKQSASSSQASSTQSSAVTDDDDDDNNSNSSATSSSSSSTPKVKYRTVNFQAQLDDIDDSRLYQSVPGTQNNQTYSWNSVNGHEGKRVYVDKQATVLTRDRDDDDDYDDHDSDDNGYDSEEYYRIRFSASNNATKYWVSEDVVDNDTDD